MITFKANALLIGFHTANSFADESKIYVMKKQILFSFLSIICSTTLIAQSWTTVTPNTLGSAKSLTIHNGALFVSTQAASPHRSTDGSSWTQKVGGLTGAGPQGGGITSVGNWIYYGSKEGMYRSNDDGNTWNRADSGLTITATNFPKWFYQFDGVYFCVLSANINGGGGLFRSDDGLIWTSSTGGIPNNQFPVQMTQVDDKLYMGTSFDLWESLDTGKNWTVVNTIGLGMHNAPLSFKGRLLVFSNFNIVYSDDSASTWKDATGGPAISTDCGFVIGAGDTLYSWATTGGVFQSVDTGATWTDINGNLSSLEKSFIQDLTYFKGNLYAATFLSVKRNGPLVTSIQDHHLEKDVLDVYPNPFKDRLVIENNEGQSSIIQLFDAKGQLIRSLESLLTRQTIDASNLAQGIYLLRVYEKENGHLISSRKLIRK